ncbi:Helicase and polymerase-containing protein TEBICHI [Pleurostoma richardsiae]|uniref:Helicase and polymerase-containing protein TEBICHI n=1 Tax=Pleurostoma richardsiae TaxID=41990 RepID=A0AA38RBF7_9PEZI|nr:Helicase and polymerase-containing protein TEBICHI [Pleurostoma richardsiae]
MADNLGLWHKTTLQAAKEHQTVCQYQTTTLAGHKRPFADTFQEGGNGGVSGHGVPGQRSPAFLPASSLRKGPPRLVASEIRDASSPAPEIGISEYSQRKEWSATPSSTQDPLLNLSHTVYGLPIQLVTNFSNLGIRSIYPWQKQCLLGPGLLTGEKNLVYSAPTGGGKSLVADVLMLKRVLKDREAKALLVLPYVALVQEKVRWLRNVVQNISREAISGPVQKGDSRFWRKRADEDTVRVVAFFGGSKINAAWTDFDIGVCTIEKANALVNTAIDDCSISQLKVVVLDELHMIDDDHRGYLLELMATKLLCLGEHAVQIIGMSATLNNISLLAKWLQGHSYETHYRPVPIEEHLVYDGNIYPAGSTRRLLMTASQLTSRTPSSQEHGTELRTIQPSASRELQDPVTNAVVALANETARSNFGVLVFASSRAGCEADALLISRVMPLLDEVGADVLGKRMDLIGDFRSLPGGLDHVLEQTIPYGVAFHHAGLTAEERELIADAYDSGVIKVCVATCSLAAGINLPARRVILHNARMGRDLVGPSMLRQMRGRAGRKGKDEIGETYLCCRTPDLEDVVELMHAELPQVTSSLITEKHRIQRALLEIISIRLATSRESIDDYIRKTLLCHSGNSDEIDAHVESSLQDLCRMGFIIVDQDYNYQETQLGRAIVTSALDPEDGLFIHKELQRALRAFVMDGDMHVLYTFTPVHDMAVNINWQVFAREMDNLDESGLRVLGLLGLKPTEINRMMRGGSMKEVTPEEKELTRVYHRFYLALQLRDLCSEMPVHRVAQKYGTPRGAVQTLAQTCQGFAAGMIKFCQQMGWGVMAAALDHFSDRLKAGAKSDLLALAKITFIKSRTARVFWDNGFKTVAAIANADPNELVPILMQAQPNKVRLGDTDEQKYNEKLLAKAKVIADSANKLWQVEMQQEVDDE